MLIGGPVYNAGDLEGATTLAGSDILLTLPLSTLAFVADVGLRSVL